MARRLQLSVAAAFLVICLLGSLALARVAGLHTEPPIAELCMDPVERERVRAIALDSIDEALRVYIRHLFDVWMADGHEGSQRASNGIRIAARAHIRARANALKWNPPEC